MLPAPKPVKLIVKGPPQDEADCVTAAKVGTARTVTVTGVLLLSQAGLLKS